MRRLALWLLLTALGLPLAAWAAEPGPEPCLACHAVSLNRSLAALAPEIPLPGAQVSLCPARNRARREIYLTQADLAAAEGNLASLAARGGLTQGLTQEHDRLLAAYRAALSQEVETLGEIGGRLGALRGGLAARVRAPLDQADQGRRQALFLALALVLAGSLTLAALLGLRRLLPAWVPGEQAGTAWRALFPWPPRGWVLAGMLAGALGTGFLLLSASGQAGPAPGPGAAALARLKAAGGPWEALDRELAGGQRRVMAWCDLAHKASASFPGLARDYLARALAEALALADPRAPSAEDDASPGAQRLRRRARAAWPLRLVAQGGLALDLDLAQRALAQGLERCRRNPDPRQRDQDLAGLLLVQAHRDPKGAARLAGQVDDPAWRAWVWRRLSQFTRSAEAPRAALAAARQVADLGQRALALAATAPYLAPHKPGAARQVAQEALALAGRLPEGRGRDLVQAQAVLLAGRGDPRLGLELAASSGLGGAARSHLLRLQVRALSLDAPAQGDRWWDAALAAAKQEANPLDSQQALAMLARDLAAKDPRQAAEALALLPAHQVLLRAGAQEALALASAGSDPAGAWLRARAIGDATVRLGLMARLALSIGRGEAGEGARELARLWQEARRWFPGDAAAILARSWAQAEPGTALELAQAIGRPGPRARALLEVAKMLKVAGRNQEAQRALLVVRQAIKSPKMQETLDKVRLLGHMGREWAFFDPDQAREFFQQGSRVVAEIQ